VFIELHASSAFSFLEAASLPETLVERAAALGYSALALVDRDGVYGAPRFHKAAKAAGIKAIIGCEITIVASRQYSVVSRQTEDRRQETEGQMEAGASAPAELLTGPPRPSVRARHLRPEGRSRTIPIHYTTGCPDSSVERRLGRRSEPT